MKTTRTLATVASGVIILFSLTGCMSISMNVTINEDQTANASYSVGYDKAAFKTMLEAGGEKVTDVCAALQESQEEGLTDNKTVETTWTETEEECVLNAKSLVAVQFDENGIKKTDEVSEMDPTEGINIVKVGDSAQVTFDTTSFTETMGDAGESAGMTWDSVINEFNMIVTFPGEISEANFSNVISEDKKTVTWDKASILESAEAGESLKATGALSAGVSFVPFAIGGIALLVILIAVIVVITLRRNRSVSAAPTIE